MRTWKNGSKDVVGTSSAAVNADAGGRRRRSLGASGISPTFSGNAVIIVLVLEERLERTGVFHHGHTARFELAGRRPAWGE
jgi:hypothetical protein